MLTYDNIDAVIIGYGALSYQGTATNRLMHVELSYVTPADCSSAYGNTFSEVEMMCASDPGQDSW